MTMPEAADQAAQLRVLLRSWIPPGMSWVLVLESDEDIELSYQASHPGGYVDSLLTLIRTVGEEAEDE